MLNGFIQFIIFLGGALAIVMASAYVIERERSDANYLTALFLCTMGIWQIYHGFMISGFLFRHPHLALVHVPFLYMSAPMLYFYYRILTRESFRFRTPDLFHFVPAVIILIVLAPFYAKSGDEKLELLQSFVGLRGGTEVFPAYPYIVMIILAVICGYAYAVGSDILKIYRRRLLSEKNTTFYSIVIVAFNFAVIIVYISGFLIVKLFYSGAYYLTIIKTISLIMTGQIYVILVLKWRYPGYIMEIKAEAMRMRYTVSRIEKIDVDHILDMLKDLMENQRIFSDEDISLARLADELDITPYQISQILNERLNKNFNAFINEYRVREAEDYLLNDTRRSILSISYAVGFNNVTSFYKAFDRIHHMTPAQFRSQNRK